MIRAFDFHWDRPAGVAALIAAIAALVPTLGAIQALGMHVHLPGFTRLATLPALLVLAACELYLVYRNPRLLNRLACGLLGGVLGTLAFDLVRAPGTWLALGAPDLAPILGQHLTAETVGIAPTLKATLLGYGYQYVLVGAMLGAAYSLAFGRGRWPWAGLAGLLGGLALGWYTPVRMIAMGEGFSPTSVAMVLALAVGAGGAVMGLVVQALAKTRANALRVVFLREERVEALVD